MTPRTRRPPRWQALVALVGLVWSGATMGDDLPFVRVIVPAAAVPEVPRGPGRFIPLPLAEFDEAVARLGGSAALRRPGASSSTYTLALTDANTLAGSLAFTIERTAGVLPSHVSLGRVSVGQCTMRTDEGSGDAVVYGVPDGGVAVRTAGPGTYVAAIHVPIAAASERIMVPLVASLVTTVDLTLPESVEPFVVGGIASLASIENAGGGRWKIVVGPVDGLPLVLREKAAVQPPLTAWTAVSVRGRQAAMVTRIEPVGSWGPGDVTMAIDPSVRVARVLVENGDDVDELRWRSADGRLAIDIPAMLVGSRRGVVVHAVAARTDGGLWTVPTIRPLPEQWAGGGVVLRVDPAIAVGEITLSDCLVVSRGDASDWPLPSIAADTEAEGVEDGPRPARMYLEHQAPTAMAHVALGPRQPVFDTARVTTVDISPGTVLGRANCDVRVVSGEAFEIVADIAPGWLIDSVEAVDFSARSSGDVLDADPAALDWRVIRTPRASELRIGLAHAATPRRGLSLRISGHRGGLPLGAEFTTAEMDMVRLIGEAADMALLEFRVGPTAVVEVAGAAMGLEPAAGRLAPLAGESPPRARIRAGERSSAVRARLVRRRPPVVADVQLSLTARDERLAEVFTFICRPVVGELDALVIHFSEPLGPGLEWSLVEPSGGTLAARPLATRGGSTGAADEAAALGLSAAELATGGLIAESWLVELRPATTTAVTIRASRTVPLETAVPVPLAWVEAAERPGGVVTIHGGRGRRPEIVNRRLRELPPSDAGADETALVELAYGSPETVLAGDGTHAADILPPTLATGARAWAWREVVHVWCHESGALEWEQTIDLENQGRDELTLSVPGGFSLETIEIAGKRVAADVVRGQDAYHIPLPLPPQRGRVTLKLGGSARREPGFGWWSVADIACGMDVPILDREAKLFLPPGLELAGSADARESLAGWPERLFRATRASRRGLDVSRPGFRGIPITAAIRSGLAEVIVVRRDVVVSLSIVAAALATMVGFLLARRSGLAAMACCVLAASAALWVESPWYAMPRAAWWGGLVGVWLAGCRPRLARGVATMLILATVAVDGSLAQAQEQPPVPSEPVSVQDPVDDMPLRVFVSPSPDGGTALVPEELFRMVTAASNGPPPVRVMAAEVRVDQAHGLWWIALDIDADRGGSLTIDQADTGGVWVPERHAASPGITIIPTAIATEARFIATVAGRHRVTLACRPGRTQEGDIELATSCLPAAARASLEILGADRPGASVAAWQCDCFHDDTWAPSVPTDTMSFDVSGASRVRVVRPVDRRDRLVAEPRTAVSTNTIDWLAGTCRVTATFDVGGDREIVRAVVVRTDPDLLPVDVAGERRPTSLDAGRWLLTRPQPRAGTARFVVAFRRALPDPVGVFEPHGVWLERVANDARTVRLRPAATLEAVVELPLGMTLMRPRVEDGPATTAVWRSDVVAAANETPLSTSVPSPRITVRRRPLSLRGSQELAVQFEESAVSLRLRCQMEASSLPLVEIPIAVPPAAVIDRMALVRENALLAMALPSEGIDIAWSRVAADRIVVMVQRPQAGRFRFELDARVPVPPPVRGRVPMARVESMIDLPLTVTCDATSPLSVTLTGPQGVVVPFLADRLDLVAGEVAPLYELVREPELPEWAPSAAGTPQDQTSQATVDLTTIDVAIDERGRCRGLVRFDVVAAEAAIRLRLPPGMRLFDVRVDGREVTATPLAGDVWDVRLHDTSWPRTIVAVMSGIVGGRLADGEPIRLDPPRIEGLESGLVLWSLETPGGFEVRVSEPSRVVDGPEWRSLLGEQRTRQAEAFAVATATVAEADSDRLQAFAAARREGTSPAGEDDWYAAWQRPRTADSVRTRLVAGAGGSVTFRAVPHAVFSAGSRGFATAVLVAIALAGWHLARRFSDAWWLVVPRLHQGWWVACGIVWIVMFEPTLPGWVMLAFGVWVVWPDAWRSRWSRARGSDISVGNTTRTAQSV